MASPPKLMLTFALVALIVLSIHRLALSNDQSVNSHPDVSNTSDAATGALARLTIEGGAKVVELSQGGKWLSVKNSDNPGGWGRLLPDTQKSIMVTNGLVITAPDDWAFDLNDSNPRNIVRDILPPDVAWGMPVNGLIAGLKAKRRVFGHDEAIRFEFYARNVGDKPFRMFACARGPDSVLVRNLRVTGPDGRFIHAAVGKMMASTGGGCDDMLEETDWSILQPGQILGPIHFKMFSSDYGTTVWDYWFDCSRPGEYRVSLADCSFPSRFSALTNNSPAWNGVASTGTVILRRQ